MAMVLASLSLEGHCFRSSSWMEVAERGAVCVYLINDDEFLRRGVVGSLCLIGNLMELSGAVVVSTTYLIRLILKPLISQV
jgi:hypothetical protein